MCKKCCYPSNQLQRDVDLRIIAGVHYFFTYSTREERIYAHRIVERLRYRLPKPPREYPLSSTWI